MFRTCQKCIYFGRCYINTCNIITDLDVNGILFIILQSSSESIIEEQYHEIQESHF